jgi:hypothetical protein
MATSGSWDYSATAAQIVYAAAENLGIVSGGATINSNDQTSMLRRLNFIAKQWQGTADMAQGLKVHTRQRVFLFLAKGQQKYTIGPASTDARATTLYGRTTVSSAYASGTSLSVTAVSDTTSFPGTTVSMTSGDTIGVVLNDGTIGWTTLNGTPVSSPATLTAGLASAARAGNYVYWFTSRAQRFPYCEVAVLRDSTSIDTELSLYRDVETYESVPDKTASGDPINVLIEPQRLNTAVTFDCQPSDVTKQALFTVIYPSEDYDATTDDIAFPQEWFAALEWELTLRCAPMFQKTWTPDMQQNYATATGIARELNPDNSDAYFQPGRE